MPWSIVGWVEERSPTIQHSIFCWVEKRNLIYKAFPQHVRVGHFGSGTGFLMTLTSAPHISQTYVLFSSAILNTSFWSLSLATSMAYNAPHNRLAMGCSGIASPS